MSGLTPALVVVVNNALDWQRVVGEGWYRIPLRHAPNPVAAEVLAFYLTRRCGDLAWHVHYYAQVRQYRLLRRRELLPAEVPHPRADEWYYRIEVGPLQSLVHPLPSRQLRRITFIPTTLEQLQSATDVAELWLTDDEEAALRTYFPDAALKATRRLAIEEQREQYCTRPKWPATFGNVSSTHSSFDSAAELRQHKEHSLLMPRSECRLAPHALHPRRLPLPPRSRTFRLQGWCQ